ncbi:MAG: hypothetical protein NWE90_06450, partial [Candidatus Bathyarchaeota archaeon]|nr:hypothetical protein [Candidatus Bathyarchaeota archaeon]
LKELINSMLAVGSGPEKILELASVCGQEVLEFTQSCIDGLSKLEFRNYIDWYLRLAAVELARKHLLFLKKRIWDPLVNRANDASRPLTKLDFRILCTASQENLNHLQRWKATGTKVRFYRDDTEAGSHRFLP